MKLIECIPNFSDGRRTEVVQAIVGSIAGIPGIHILDQHSDHDHNRSVVTFAGAPEAVREAAFAGIAMAASRIDLEQHRGEHPRLGAADVVPFVPLGEASLDECVTLAETLGARVGDELGIPVYLYEAAARRPERVNLEDIRRGEYEQLKQTIGEDPDRAPDFGPSSLGPAGATVIGARKPLIAYNVYLTTDDVGIAKRIARAVRHSSGGLRFVKALGLLVDGRAQVSMNLTDFERTPIHRAVELIRREAERYGVGIHHSELVGLTPQAALVQAAQWYLHLDGFEPDQILESRLYAAGMPTSTTFLDQLAAGTATPGGGSAAAFAAAMGASLLAMVARLTIGKKGYEGVESRMKDIVQRAEALRTELQAAVDADAQAFNEVMQALKMPRSSEPEVSARADALETATIRAAEIPLQAATRAAEVLDLALELAEKGNASAVSDSGTAGALAAAALRAASLNVQINAAGMRDEAKAKSLVERMRSLQASAEKTQSSLRKILQERAGIEG